MTLKIYGLKSCDTCRKAAKDIEASGRAAEFIDLREAGAGLAAKLPGWLKAAGDKLLNKNSTTWRGLSDDDKARAAGPTLEGLLLGHPALIKRPVIEADGEVLVGWTPETRAKIG
jgi:arsenate reductase (glutaredoxin)